MGGGVGLGGNGGDGSGEGEGVMQRLQVTLQFFFTFFFVAHLLSLSTHLLVAHMSTHGGEGVGEDAAGAAGPDNLAAWTQFSMHKAASNLSRRKLLQFSFR